MKDTKIEIPFCWNKMFRGTGFSILFVILGTWLFFWGPQQIAFNPMLVKGIGLVGVLIFGYAGILGLTNLIAISDRKVGLVIEKAGIVDNSSTVSIGLIEWSDITGIRIGQVLFSKFLLIDTNSPEKYLQKAKNKMKAKFMRIDMKKYGTPLVISTSNLSCNFDELEELIKREFEKKK